MKNSNGILYFHQYMFTSGNKVWYFFLAACSVITLYLFNPFHFYFQNDDFIHISLSKDWVWLQRNTFRPICDLSVALDYILWKKNAVGYHFTNLLLHFVNIICVYWFVHLLSKKYEWENAVWLSISTAVFFFCYAFHSEAIFWILGRSASLGSLFVLLSLCFFVKAYLISNNRWALQVSTLIFACIAWVTYESSWIILPALLAILLFDYKVQRHFNKRMLLSILILTIAFLVYLYVRKIYTGEVAGNYDASAFLELDFKRLFINYSKLLGRVILPPADSSVIFLVMSALVLVLLSWGVYLLYKKEKSIVVVVLLLLVSPLPYCSFGANTHTVEAERYLYLPSVFAVMLLVHIIGLFKQRNLLMAALLFVHLYFLNSAATAYQTAGNMVKTTLDAVKKYNVKDRIFVFNLPQQVNGALVFRTGFENAVLWAVEPQKNKELVILNMAEDNKKWQSNYQSESIFWRNYLLPDSVYQSVNGQAKEYQKVKYRGKPFSSNSDLIFIYEPGVLKIAQ